MTKEELQQLTTAQFIELVRDYSSLQEMSKSNRRLYRELLSRTNFLSKGTSFEQRLFCLNNNISIAPSCTAVNCTNPVKWKDGQYNTYCSRPCYHENFDLANEKRKQTNVKRHGVENVNYIKGVREKIEQTNIKRYGFKSANQNAKIKEKISNTNLDRYGFKNPLSRPECMQHIKDQMIKTYGFENAAQVPEFKEKRKKTSLKKYGFEHPTQNPSIKKNVINTCIKKFGYENAMQSDEIKEKARNAMVEKYGVEHALQSKKIKQKRLNTYIKNHGVTHPTQLKISPESRELLDDSQWLFTQHHVLKRTLWDISCELNISDTTLARYFDSADIDKLRFGSSQAERDIVTLLESYNIVCQTNNRKLIYPFELDILLPEYNIAIEYCGLYWHCDKEDRIHRNYHLDKYNKCKNLGIRLITIFEDEWRDNKELITNKLLHILNKSNSKTIFARKCAINDKVKLKDKKELFTKHHIQGIGRGSITYSLQYDNQDVAMITFLKRSEGVWELNRYATSINVVGGFSKLLKYFQQNNKWTKIISFADLRYSDGAVYEKTGFVMEKQLPPDYSYFYKNKRVHKFNFRHKNLPNLLENYDPTLSETKNTRNHGIYKIWNCGLKRYVLTS